MRSCSPPTVSPQLKQGPPGKDGKDGKDGLPGEITDEQLEQLVIQVVSQIQQQLVDQLTDEQIKQLANRLPPIYPQWIDQNGEVIDEVKAGVKLGQTMPLRIRAALSKANAR